MALLPWTMRNDLSRLVMDPERFLDECAELNTVGRCAVLTPALTTDSSCAVSPDSSAAVYVRFRHRMDRCHRPRPALCIGTDSRNTRPQHTKALYVGFSLRKKSPRKPICPVRMLQPTSPTPIIMYIWPAETEATVSGGVHFPKHQQ